MEHIDSFQKTGRELLPPDIVEYFQEFRSVDYLNVLRKRLSEYTFAEWMVCLQERVLLEQCVPFFIEILDKNPLHPGYFEKGYVLCAVTLIDKIFWDDHKDWYLRVKSIVDGVLDSCENKADSVPDSSENNVDSVPDLSKNKADSGVIRGEYIEAYRSF